MKNSRTKDFKTIDEQIELLKSRNLIIPDVEKAKKYLLTQNYYNIINGYASYFPRNGEVYTNGTTFDEITHLYIYEQEIKHSIFKAILCMENHLKAVFSYHFAHAYNNTPYAYLNISCYDPEKTLSVIPTITKITRILTAKQKHADSSISHYMKNYKNVPIWVLANYLEFGNVRYMLNASHISIQNAVAKDMYSFIREHVNTDESFSPEIMLSFIENINDVRNICAHNNRLLGYNCRSDSKYWAPLHSIYGITKNDSRRSIFSVLILLRCFLSKTEYATLHNRILNESKRLNNRLKSICPNEILKQLGFPENWQTKTEKVYP